MVAIDPVNIQIENFIMMVFCGIIIGFLFDGYRVLRGILNPKTFFTSVGDLVFWVMATVVVFTILIFTNWGEVRLYVFLGLVLGFTAYVSLLSHPVIYALIKTWQICAIIRRWSSMLIYKWIWQPVIWLISMIMWPCLWLYRKPGRYLINTSRAIGKRYKDTIVKQWFAPKEPPENPKH